MSSTTMRLFRSRGVSLLRNTPRTASVTARLLSTYVPTSTQSSIPLTFDSASATAQAEKLKHDVRYPMIVPTYWTGVEDEVIPYSEYSIDCSKYDMSTPTSNPELVQRMHEMFEKTGLVLLTNTGLTEYVQMHPWAEVIVSEGMTEYKAGANPRNSVSELVNVFDTGAPKEAHLHYHTEMAYVGKSCTRLAFCVSDAVQGKGEMFVSDKLQATDYIMKTEFGQKMKELGICYIRNLTNRKYYEEHGIAENGVYNHWQHSFGVETVEEVEAIAKDTGLQIEWDENQFLKTKYYVSAFEYFPQMDRNVIYSSLADDSVWFDTWPGVMDLPTMSNFKKATPTDRPLKLVFGDDSELSREELELYIGMYDKFGIPLRWQVGDVAMVCNYRFAHGRPAYSLDEGEKRTLGVILGQRFQRIGQKDDAKW